MGAWGTSWPWDAAVILLPGNHHGWSSLPAKWLIYLPTGSSAPKAPGNQAGTLTVFPGRCVPGLKVKTHHLVDPKDGGRETQILQPGP